MLENARGMVKVACVQAFTFTAIMCFECACSVQASCDMAVLLRFCLIDMDMESGYDFNQAHTLRAAHILESFFCHKQIQMANDGVK